jgi:peptide deformylase
MALRQIRVVGDDILRKVSKPVKNVNLVTKILLDDMLDTLRDRNGVGLAAPQVGVLKRIVVVEFEDKLYELINPEIIKTDGEQRCDEACLSVPGRQGAIDRPMRVVVQAQNRDGETYTLEGKDFLASVLCHELDHLDGVLYIDKALSVKDEPDDDDDQRKR